MSAILQRRQVEDFQKWSQIDDLECRRNVQLTNPSKRREIRADFPIAMSKLEPGRIVKTLEQELVKHGTRMNKVGKIYAAYPHKHPQKFRGHQNNAYPDFFINNLRYERRYVDWVIADSIVETVHLNRSGNQSSIHALTGKQIYELDGYDNPFVAPDGKPAKPYFIVFDHFMEQGTTVANMISFIEHNGGTVLLVVASSQCVAQIPTGRLHPEVSLSGEFTNATRNTGRLPELAKIFADSAQRSPRPSEQQKPTPQDCLELFEKALNRHNNSVYALTDGECMRLRDVIGGEACAEKMSFPQLIAALDATVPMQTQPLPQRFHEPLYL